MSEVGENDKASAKSEGRDQVRACRTEGKAKLIVLAVYSLSMRLWVL